MHQINIAVHVLAGSVALVVGFAALFVTKKYTWHTRFGRIFMWAMVFVILTGLVGVFVFKRNTFLLVITMLSGYTCFSGIRAVRLRGQKPRLTDRVVPLVVMASAFYYLYYIHSIGLYWAPVVIFSTLGALFLVTLYDLSRSFLPAAFLKKAFLYEHVYKMVSALSALASAFAGTVLPQYKPYSQFLPGTAGLAYVLFVFVQLLTKSPRTPPCSHTHPTNPMNRVQNAILQRGK